MHMARRAAAWVAWVEWTCDIRQVAVTVKESGLRPALFLKSNTDGGTAEKAKTHLHDEVVS